MPSSYPLHWQISIYYSVKWYNSLFFPLHAYKFQLYNEPRMSNQSKSSQPLELSALDFGPAWARADKPNSKVFHKGKNDDSRSEPRGKFSKGKRGDSSKGGGSYQRREDKPGRREYSNERPKPRQRELLPEYIKASIMPKEEGVDALVKQISATGRTYSVFDLARLVLKARERYVIAFQVAEESTKQIFQSITDFATFLTIDECITHFAQSEKFSEIYIAHEVEIDPPKGNFPSIACCGFTDEPIAPSNFHEFQSIVAQRHAADFSNMSLEKYKSRIKTVRDEEKVAQWLESMKKVTKYKLASDESVEFENKSAALAHFQKELFAEEFPTHKRTFVASDASFKTLSEGLASGLLEVIAEQNRYPGDLSSFLCRQLSGRKLAVYKWQNKLHAGPSRPHQMPQESPLADRPQAIYTWMLEHSGQPVDKMWEAVLPKDLAEEENDNWLKDLKWMLTEGYLVLLENGRLHLSSDSKKKTGSPAKKNPKSKQAKQGKTEAKSKALTPKTEDASKVEVTAKAKKAPKAEATAKVKEVSVKETAKAEATTEAEVAPKVEDKKEQKLESKEATKAETVDKPAAE